MTDERGDIARSAHVAEGVRLGEQVDIGPGAVILSRPLSEAPTIIGDRAEIGANATILAGLSIGFESIIRPGSVVTRSVPPRAIAEGNPALIVGYVDADSDSGIDPSPAPDANLPRVSRVEGVELIALRTARDLRGTLSVAEADSDIPFQPLRTFLVYDVPTVETRGEHAHRRCHQVLVAVAGTVRVVADDGREREEFRLDSPAVGLVLPAMTWGIQYGFSPDAVLMVLASERYDADDYLRSYSDFLQLKRATA